MCVPKLYKSPMPSTDRALWFRERNFKLEATASHRYNRPWAVPSKKLPLRSRIGMLAFQVDYFQCDLNPNKSLTYRLGTQLNGSSLSESCTRSVLIYLCAASKKLLEHLGTQQKVVQWGFALVCLNEARDEPVWMCEGKLRLGRYLMNWAVHTVQFVKIHSTLGRPSWLLWAIGRKIRKKLQ